MTTKEYLRSVRRMGLEIEIKQLRVEQLRSIAEGTTRQITGMPSGNGNPQRAQSCIEAAAMMEEEIQKQASVLLEEQRTVGNAIMRIATVEHRLLLEMYYLLGWNWEKVSQKMCYTERWIHKLHSEALKEFSKVHCNSPLKADIV